MVRGRPPTPTNALIKSVRADLEAIRGCYRLDHLEFCKTITRFAGYWVRSDEDSAGLKQCFTKASRHEPGTLLVRVQLELGPLARLFKEIEDGAPEQQSLVHLDRFLR